MKKLIIIAFAFTLFSCDNKLEINHQKVYFEVHHANYAWGYYNFGVLIDSAGNVNSFNLKSVNDWAYPDKNGNITENSMINNYIRCTSVIRKIQLDSLNYYINKIPKALKGTLSKPQSIMADAGITEYNAYIYDKNTKLYQKVLLFQWGDNQITNNSKEAKELYHWLVRVLKDVKQ